ncbi:MAG: hypothetical protein ABI577_15865 [bacterium]
MVRSRSERPAPTISGHAVLSSPTEAQPDDDSPISAPLKFLWLGNSNDNPAREGVATGARRPELMAAELEALLERPVTLVGKAIWPEEVLPGIVERWMEREKPEIVWLDVAAYWVCYESSPARVKRWFGRLGQHAAAYGERAGRTKWLAERRTFRAVRKLTQIVIGGDPAFSTEDVIERITRCARIILRGEDVLLVIEAPRGRNNMYATRGAVRRGEVRRLRVHKAMRALATELHCGFLGSDVSLRESAPIRNFQKDAFHMDETGHALSAAMDFPALRDAVLEHRENWLSDSNRAKLYR